MAETNIRGIFGVGDLRKRQLAGLVPERTRETYRGYGYFGGTFAASRVDRIDFSNDTATGIFRKNIRAYAGATGNSNFGYFGGGYFPISTVDRINYSNDTAVEALRGPLSSGGRWRFSATGNSNFGYFGGGARQNSNTIVSTVDRINYSNDLSQASIRGPLSLPKGFTSSSGNSNFGYYYCGANPDIPASYSNIERINYSNDLTKPLVRGLVPAGNAIGGATGNSNFGYVLGNGYTRLQRIDYSNDLVAAVNRAITNTYAFRGATGNSNFGYFGGGYTSFSLVDRLDYANDNTQTSLRGPLSYGRTTMSATSSSSFGGSTNSSYASNFTFPTVPNAGYFGGGSDGTNALASIDKVDYANDTATASVRSALSLARERLAATGNSNFGYFAGNIPASSIVDRLDYSSDNQNTVIRAPLGTTTYYQAATGNSNFGYFGGGFPYPNLSIYRINYSNDLSTDSTIRGPLIASSRYRFAATGNSNFGYFGGGIFPGPVVSSVDRLDYSSDTSICLARGPLSNAKYDLAATGNSNFGYFGGGQGTSRVDRIDYSNDTATASVRGLLSSTRYGHAATGSQNFGYFGGAFPYVSSVNKINYSNDTAVASIRGPLSVAKYALAATSPLAYGGAPIYSTNPLPQVFQKQITFNDSNTLSDNLPYKRVLGSYGYFGGGFDNSGVRFSSINRVDYSNDTATASERGPLSLARSSLGATGNSNFGYYGGGSVSAPDFRSLVDRLDYSNDLSITNNRGNLIQSKNGISAVGNNNFGYFAGGFSPISTVNRLNYSADTTVATPRGSLSSPKTVTATGNSNFGYFGSSSTIPTVDRINYSNDNVNLLIRGPLSLARQTLAATGNSNFGYFGGGFISPPLTSLSSIDRINYSNDTLTASIRSNLVNPDYALSATGNSNFGYFSGFPTFSTSRLDYSNDTANCILRTPMIASRYRATTTNARNS